VPIHGAPLWELFTRCAGPPARPLPSPKIDRARHVNSESVAKQTQVYQNMTE
jgi:hypothetical protein